MWIEIYAIKFAIWSISDGNFCLEFIGVTSHTSFCWHTNYEPDKIFQKSLLGIPGKSEKKFTCPDNELLYDIIECQQSYHTYDRKVYCLYHCAMENSVVTLSAEHNNGIIFEFIWSRKPLEIDNCHLERLRRPNLFMPLSIRPIVKCSSHFRLVGKMDISEIIHSGMTWNTWNNPSIWIRIFSTFDWPFQYLHMESIAAVIVKSFSIYRNRVLSV